MMMLLWASVNVAFLLPNVSEVFTELSIHLVAFIDGLIFGFWILFFDLYSGSNSVTKRLTAGFTVLGMALLIIVGLFTDVHIVGFALTVKGTNLITIQWSDFSSLVLFPGYLLGGYWAYKDLSTTAKKPFSRREQKQIWLMKIGVVLIFILGVVLSFFGIVFIEQGSSSDSRLVELGVISLHFLALGIFIPLGLILISLSYGLSNQVAFLIPQEIDSLIIVHDSGIPLLKYDFRELHDEKDPLLIGGAITAITTLMREAFNVTTKIREVIFQDRLLLLEIRETTAFILVAERKSTFIVEALKRTADNFMQRFHDELKVFNGEIDVFQPFIPEILKAFGYAMN